MTLALPKPTRADRKKVAIDTLDLALPKKHFTRDAEYRAWVITHRCLLPRYEKPCGSVIGRGSAAEAAHLQHGGKAEKGSDASCVPLCGVHHAMLDAETLPWQIVAFLWMKCWELREEWHRRAVR